MARSEADGTSPPQDPAPDGPRRPFAQASAPVACPSAAAAYHALREAGASPVLLDAGGLHPDARWAFVAFDPLLELRYQDGAVEERWADGAIDVAPCDALRHLREATEAYRVDVREPVPFTGGWVGLFGFGFTAAIEPTLAAALRAQAKTDPLGSLPDALLRLCRGAVAFDLAAATARLFVADLDGDQAAAEARLGEVARVLQAATLPPDLAHVGGTGRPDQWPLPASAPPPASHSASVPQPAPPSAATPAPQPTPPAASLGREAFEAAAIRLRGLVHEGDHFQANLATRFSVPFEGDPLRLHLRLLAANPAPYMLLLEADGFAVASGSPEQLLRMDRRQGSLESRPIAGTRKRSSSPAEDAAMEAELRLDAKEQAEHTMLVDLVRNDVAKACVPGTVRVPERGLVERYRHVMHLASRVEGRLRPDAGFADALAALFPGGTVTGAPKVRAVQRILESEPVPRGPYTGSAGYLSWSHNAAWSILIRTLVVQDGQAHAFAGSGIVADSDPAREWKEAQRKARALVEAATGTGSLDASPGRLGEAAAGSAWQPPTLAPRHAGARVLLIDNYDSFVHNLADYLAALGAATLVVRNDADWRAALRRHRATHVVLSPGPGWPDGAGCTLEVLGDATLRLPILGVCLGHQAIGQAAGGRVTVHPQGPVHGKADLVHHGGQGLFAGLPSPLEAARYHSLVVQDVPPGEWVVDARLPDGTVMALRHRSRPVHGLQFHPESLCTPLGLELLDRFLATAPSAEDGAAAGIQVTR